MKENDELEKALTMVRKQYLLLFSEAYVESNSLSYAATCANEFIKAIMFPDKSETGEKRDVFSAFKM